MVEPRGSSASGPRVSRTAARPAAAPIPAPMPAPLGVRVAIAPMPAPVAVVDTTVPTFWPLLPPPVTLPSESMVSLPPESALRGALGFQQFTAKIGTDGDHNAVVRGNRKRGLKIDGVASFGAARGDTILKHDANTRSRRNHDRFAGAGLGRCRRKCRRNCRRCTGLRPVRLLSRARCDNSQHACDQTQVLAQVLAKPSP